MEYYNTLNDMYTSNDQLVHNFQESILPASIFNLGPNTVTLDHIDYANVAYGLCGISALGKYNPDKGGHMILFDLGVMICFPPDLPFSYLPVSFATLPRSTQHTLMN
jgi:hypothetical protein